MQKFICCTFILTSALLSSAASAQHTPAGKEKKCLVSASLGYHAEDFKWSIAGNIHGNDPNVYSELTWDDLKGVKAAFNLQWNFYRSFIFRADFSNVFISSGKVTDIDYQDDNRESPSFYGAFASDRGNLTSLRVMAGYKLPVYPRCTVIPYLGYSAERQKLFLLDDKQHRLNGLNSTYTAVWNGPVAGVRILFAITEEIGIEPLFLYHQMKYTAEADWNLIEQFRHPVSFEHFANGFGIDSKLTFHYRLASQWSVHLTGGYAWWDTGKGEDKLYLADGQSAVTQLNGAGRNSFGLAFGSSFSF